MTRTLATTTSIADFVDCINRGDVAGLGALMTDDHELRVFDEEPLPREAGERRRAWHGYAAAFPGVHHRRARRSPSATAVVAVLGHTTGSHLGLPAEEEQELTLIWLAEVADGLVRSWTLVRGHPCTLGGNGGCAARARELSTASRCVCETAPPMPPSSPLPDDAPLRIAWLVYRGNPHCGGQGVYTRYLARELADLGPRGHGVLRAALPRARRPAAAREGPQPRPLRPSRTRSGRRGRGSSRRRSTSASSAIMCGAGFPEPYTFSLRARRLLQHRRADFDIVHDNQCLGTGLLAMMHEDGWPVLCTLHHPITVDRDLDLAHATSAYRRFVLSRWYGFLEMQMRVAREMPRARHRVGVEQARHRRADGRRPPTGSTSCPSASTRRSSGRCPRSRACPGG